MDRSLRCARLGRLQVQRVDGVGLPGRAQGVAGAPDRRHRVSVALGLGVGDDADGPVAVAGPTATAPAGPARIRPGRPLGRRRPTGLTGPSAFQTPGRTLNVRVEGPG
jgi:hypothetical protein